MVRLSPMELGGFALDEVGEKIGKTRERVRQIEEAAFGQLRKSDSIKDIEDIFKYLYKHL